MRRPAFYLALAFSGGILLCRAITVESVILVGVLSFAAAFVGMILPRGRLSTVASLTAALMAGLFVCSYRERALKFGDLRQIFSDRAVRLSVRGVLMHSPAWRETAGDQSHFCCKGTSLLSLREVEMPDVWRPVRGRVRVTFLSGRPIPISCGDLIQVNGTIRRISKATNPGQFDRRVYWHRRGVDYSLLVKGETGVRLLHSGWIMGPWRVIERARKRLRRGLEHGIPDCPERRIILAMILGYRGGVGDEVSAPFRNTNTLHILAISGLHVGFMYLMIKVILKVLIVPPRFTALIAISLIAAYAAVTGLHVPVVRASLMFVCFLAAPLFGRRTDSVNSLGVAACILLAINPLQLFDPGFQLSFVAVLSILLLAEPIAGLFLRVWPCAPLAGQLLISRGERIQWHIGRKLILLFSTSIAAWAGLAPLIAKTFHVVSPLGLIANLVVIPSGLAIVCLGFSGAMASLVFPPLATLFNNLNCLVVYLMRRAVMAIGSIPYGWFYAAAPTPLQFASYYGLLAICGLVIVKRGPVKVKPLVLLAAAVIVILPFAFSPEKPLLTVTFLDVGEGDATYIELPAGENLLIDGGPQRGFPAGRMVISPFLKSRGRARVDTVLLTHPHLDHISGLFTVLEEFSVERVVLAGWGDSSKVYRQFLELARKKGIPVYMVGRGDSLAVGAGLKFTVINPGPSLHCGTRSDLNNNSVALLLEYGSVRILLCADMEREAEEDLCSGGLPSGIDILRTGHHGSATSSTYEFLRRVSPRWAIISAGANNRFGHPSPEALVRLRELGIKILRTDLHGAITLTTDGQEISLETFR